MNTRIDLEQSRKMAKDLLKAFKAGDKRALDHIRWNHPRFHKLPDADIKAGEFALADAQLVIARTHHIESWPKLLQYVESIKQADPAVKRFEDAADAIISGNVELLRTMLREYPGLIHERSTRAHNSTLLHYVSANGVENYRQVTPPNIVEITALLLDSGAEVDAKSNAYGGGSTTLGLTATSAHPRLAGVQIALMDLLIDRGAVVGPIDRSGGPVHGCVANGCPEAAVHLVKRFASADNLYGAAGLGDYVAVQQLFPHATVKEREGALVIAAQCNHTGVAGLLIDNGVDAGAYVDGMTALHWACGNANLKLMAFVLELTFKNKLPLETPLDNRNEFGGTVLSSTLWFAHHALPDDFYLRRRDYAEVLNVLISLGARTDLYPTMQQDIDRIYERAQS